MCASLLWQRCLQSVHVAKRDYKDCAAPAAAVHDCHWLDGPHIDDLPEIGVLVAESAEHASCTHSFCVQEAERRDGEAHCALPRRGQTMHNKCAARAQVICESIKCQHADCGRTIARRRSGARGA